ncbi:MAG: DinB family protein [Acidobacteriota bacterium]
MADLLECLVQIRALREAPKRLEALARRFSVEVWLVRPAGEGRSAAEELAALAEAELLWGVRIRAILTAERPLLPGFDPDTLVGHPVSGEPLPAIDLSRFRARRGENLELLDRCSAADLERRGRLEEGGEPSIADVVAIMLAADTERFGTIREYLELRAGHAEAESRRSGPGQEEGDDA